MKAVPVVAGAVSALIVGARLADVRPPVPAGPPSFPAPPAPQPAAPVPFPGDPGSGPAIPARAAPDPAADPAASGAPIPSVSGVVLDEEGLPVPGAEVEGPFLRRSVAGSCYPLRSFHAVADAEGRFAGALPRLPEDREPRLLLERVAGEGFLEAGVPAPDGAWRILRAGGSLDGLVVVLRRAAVAGGVVLDGDGREVAGALVEIAGPGAPPGARYARTGAGGRFRLGGLDPREPATIAAEHLGAVSAAHPLAGLLDPARPLEVEIVLPDLHRASVAVRDAGATAETLLFLDGACEGEGGEGGEGRAWEAETTVGPHVIELWNGGDLRIRETVEPARPGERVLVEVDAAGRATREVVPLTTRGCRLPGGAPARVRAGDDPPPE